MSINNFRKHGNNPFRIVAVHGGPGAAGTLYDLCEGLADLHGTLEPFQTEFTIKDQITELDDLIYRKSNTPVYLLGHSWGAWLSLLYTAQYPEKVEKLLMVSSGPLEEKYVKILEEKREKRMTKSERGLLDQYLKDMRTYPEKSDYYFKQVGELISKIDSFETVDVEAQDKTTINREINQQIWKQAEKIRKEGGLTDCLNRLTVPLCIIHGRYDPHPYAGIKVPVLQYKPDASIYLLNKCGHYPWREKFAKAEFYKIIKEALSKS